MQYKIMQLYIPIYDSRHTVTKICSDVRSATLFIVCVVLSDIAHMHICIYTCIYTYVKIYFVKYFNPKGCLLHDNHIGRNA